MFSSNKSLVIATLLTGTAVATGVMMYGALNSVDENLIILDDTLPPVLGNGLLPPPATYVMTTPPPAKIPGIRRLKIMRPTITGAGAASGQSDEDFYLVGTRSAELIRDPVEARIETFPSVSLEEAAEGALAVDEWGFQVVQSYLNQSLGDDNALKDRMGALLAQIELMAGDYDLGTITDAANLIVEAGARAHWSAFLSPFVLDKSFELSDDAIGWDFGPEELKPYEKFTRVSANSEMLQGKYKSNEGSANGASILRNGVRNAEEFVASGLKNGTYRIVILTAPRSNGTSPLYPFGVDFKRNGGKVNVIDTRATDDLVPVMRLSTTGPGRLSDAGTADEATTDDAFDKAIEKQDTSDARGSDTLYSMRGTVTAGALSADMLLATNRNDAGYALQSMRLIEPLAKAGDFAPFYQTSGTGGGRRTETGYMLVTRAEVVDGTLRISFRQLGGQDTYVTAVIIYPEPDVDIIEELQEELVEFVEKVAPAAEGIPTDAREVMTANPAIVSVETVFEDNANGLPSEEGAAAVETAQEEAQAATEAALGVPTQTEETAQQEDTTTTDAATDPTAPTTEDAVDVVAEDVVQLEPAPEPTPDPVPAPDPVPEPDPVVPTPDPAPEPDPTPAPVEPPVEDPVDPPVEPPVEDPVTPPAEPPVEDPVEPPVEPPVEEPPVDVTPPPPPPEDVIETKELVLDAGGGADEVYDPVLLGEDFLLDGCGSTFEEEFVCSLTDTSEFEIVWILNGEEIGTGQQLLVQTGEGTRFDQEGNVNISSVIRFDGRLLENGEIININSQNGGTLFLPGDIILTSLDTAIINIYTVPEPEAFFLLVPGLILLARRERRRKKRIIKAA